MSVFLVILLVALMIATLVALIRGLVVFLSNASEEARRDPNAGPSASALKSNKMMQYRILFQAGAILVAALLLLMFGKHG